MERKQHETLMVYFKGRCNGSGPNSSTLPGLLPCLPSWRFIFPYKSPCCWNAPVCLLHCSYYADSLEGWALSKGLCPAGPCFPDWGALPSLRIAWGLRSTLTQSFQEEVTKPWPPLDLEGEGRTVGAGAGGEKRKLGGQRDQERTLGFCDPGFWPSFQGGPRAVAASGLQHCPALPCGHATCFPLASL